MAVTKVATASITFVDLNDAIISGTPPNNPTPGLLWIDNSIPASPRLKKWSGSGWVDQPIDLKYLDPDADGKIENATQVLLDMANDSVITQAERIQILNDLITMTGMVTISDTTTSLPTAATIDASIRKGSFYNLRQQALSAGFSPVHIDIDALEDMYLALCTYLNGMTPKPWDVWATTNISVTGTTWRTNWLNYYDAETKLSQSIINKLKGDTDTVAGRVTTTEGDIYDLGQEVGLRVTTLVYNQGISDVQASFDTTIGKNKWITRQINMTSAEGNQANYLPSYASIAGKQPDLIKFVSDATTFRDTFGAIDNYIGYFATAVYVATAKVISFTITHDDGCQIYLNGVSAYTKNTSITVAANVNLSLSQGWNSIEIIHAEQTGTSSGFTLSVALATLVDNLSCYGLGDLLGGRLTSAEASIKVSSDEIALRATKTEVAGVKVGGINMLKKSALNSVTEILTNSRSGYGIKFSVGDNGTTWKGWPGLSLLTNTDYMVSFVAWTSAGNVDMSVDLFPDTLPEKTFTITPTPTKFTGIYNSASTDMASCSLRFFKSGYTFTQDLYITDILFVRGNREPDWSPAPEDIDSVLDDYGTRIYDAEQIIKPGSIASIVTDSLEFTEIMKGKADSSSLGSYATNAKVETLENTTVPALIESKVDTKLKDLDLSTFTKFSTLEQTATKLQTNFVTAGGVNLLKNSVGFAGYEFWTKQTNNEILNADLKDGTTNYTLNAGWTLDTSTKYQGFDTFKVVKTGLGADAWSAVFTNFINVVPGEILHGSWYVFVPTAHGIDNAASIELEWLNSSNVKISGVGAAISIAAGNLDKWVRVTCSGTAPATTAKARIRVHPNRNGTFWATLPQLERVQLTQWSPALVDLPTDNSMISVKQSEELETKATGSAFYISTGGKLIQSTYAEYGEVDPSNPGTKIAYTLSTIVNTIGGGKGYLRVYDGEVNSATYMEIPLDGTEYDYTRFGITIVPTNNKLTVEICTYSGSVTYSGIMLNRGISALQWTMAPGEVYNTSIRMDQKGLKVSKIDNGKETKFTMMTPDRFAGFYDVDGDGVIDSNEDSPDEVFKMAEDKFVMKKAVVKNEIVMGGLKAQYVVTATNQGWAFIPYDGD